jgi:hypothetical protein
MRRRAVSAPRPRGAAAILRAALLLALPVPSLQAQDRPHLSGTLEVTVGKGGMAGDMCLAGLPAEGDTLRFVLHRGLNVKRVRDATGAAVPHMVEPEPHGVGLRYAVQGPAPDTAPGAGAPRRVCVEYAGVFPVYDVAAGDYRHTDNMGVVAFNGRTLRALSPARWYPVPYHAGIGHVQEPVTFDLRVRCASCDWIYVSGLPPRPGPEAAFVSDAPRALGILAGAYPVQEVAGTRFLGEQVAPDSARRFVEHLAEIQRFYEELLEVPFGESPDILRIVPVRPDRPGQLWGFFSDPIIGLVGLPIGEFVRILDDADHPARPLVHGFLAHELAHRYFSGALAGPFNQLFGEPFANYLDLKVTRRFQGEAAYLGRLRALQGEVLAGPALPPMDEADGHTLADDDYRYRYAPLLLLALEREIGEDRMRRVLHELLTAPEAEQAHADFPFFRRAALRAGVPEPAWHRWEEACMRPPVAHNRCLRELLP